jgi:hypothetical protein
MRPTKILKMLTMLLLCSITCKAQNNQTTQATELTLGIILPDNTSGIDQSQIQKIGTKIIQLINSSNQATVGYNNDFVLYPVISVDETNTVEGGMQQLTIVTIDCSLFIKQVSTNIVYSTISKKLKGSGNNVQQAITNALDQIKPNEPSYAQFIADAKTKIFRYYKDNCKTILQNATHLNYEEAISNLQSIPAICGLCYDAAQKRSMGLYDQYQSVLCTKTINKAKAALALNNFPSALETLETVDPTSVCATEAQQLITQIANKVGQVQQKAKREQQREMDLEQSRINAMKEIAKEYYVHTIRLIRYNIIIRR